MILPFKDNNNKEESSPFSFIRIIQRLGIDLQIPDPKSQLHALIDLMHMRKIFEQTFVSLCCTPFNL